MWTIGNAERRAEIIKKLCRRRYDTVANLANEFGVSERTIRRDIEILSCTEPIYTKTGRYYGGVYVVDGYCPNKLYLSDIELELLLKIYLNAEAAERCILADEEKKLLKKMIVDYSKNNTKNYERILTKNYEGKGKTIIDKSV